MKNAVSDGSLAMGNRMLNPGQSITLTLQQAANAYLHINSVTMSADVWRFAERLAPVLAKGGTITIPAAVLGDVAVGLGQEDPPVQAMADPVSTTVVVVVLVAAAIAGFALGYGLSDAADQEGGGTITVTNDGGDVEINVGGGGNDDDKK